MYKESEGSVLILHSPKYSKKGEGSGAWGRFSLSADKAGAVQRVGASPDLGRCAGNKKVRGRGRGIPPKGSPLSLSLSLTHTHTHTHHFPSHTHTHAPWPISATQDGERCTMPVNRAECEYCIHHAQTALKKLNMTGSRPELQGGGRSYMAKSLHMVARRGEREGGGVWTWRNAERGHGREREGGCGHGGVRGGAWEGLGRDEREGVPSRFFFTPLPHSFHTPQAQTCPSPLRKSPHPSGKCPGPHFRAT